MELGLHFIDFLPGAPDRLALAAKDAGADAGIVDDNVEAAEALGASAHAAQTIASAPVHPAASKPAVQSAPKPAGKGATSNSAAS